MAIIMQNPDNVPGAVSTGYQLQNELLYAGNTGFCNVNFNLYDTNFGAYIYGGSIFEMNGKLIKLTIHEYISGINSIPYNSYFYIYAKMNGTSVSFYASTNPATWDIDKCGFYYANDRALVKVALMRNGKFAQVHFDTDIHNSSLIMPLETDAKTLVYEVIQVGTGLLPFIYAGWYHVTVAGAGGGSLQEYTHSSFLTAVGGRGGYISKTFYIPYGQTYIKATIGAGGKNGYNAIAPTAGGITSFESPEFGISLIAYGGKEAIKNINSDDRNAGNNINPNVSGGNMPSFLPDVVGDAEPGKITLYKFS